MKFLVDNALSPFVSEGLKKLGHDAVHVREIGLERSTDEVIFQEAFDTNRIIVAADTDFSILLSKWKHPRPSLILFRKGIERNPVRQVEILRLNLTAAILDELEKGCILVLEENRMRLRSLPIG